MLSDLSRFLKVDTEKQALIDDILNPPVVFHSKKHVLRAPQFDFSADLYEADACYSLAEPDTKFCPQCHRKYPEEENVCYDCLVTLNPLSDRIPIEDIKANPSFKVTGANRYADFKTILTEENVEIIDEFAFTSIDYDNIIRNIKVASLHSLDDMIKDNYVDMTDINILEKVLLFTKSFVNVDYKSYGRELGYYESQTITVDDRQTDCLQITTLIHELSHFILNEIITEVLCKLLDCERTGIVEVIATHILSCSNFACLIDEYSAHCCEGRFTVYGYQDYSSFLNIIRQMDGEMTGDEIEITKSIGNTFANSIKDILETFIDRELLRDIKKEFLRYHVENPNYEMLKLENCQVLTGDGFLRAIWLIVVDGFKSAVVNRESFEKYYNGDNI